MARHCPGYFLLSLICQRHLKCHHNQHHFFFLFSFFHFSRAYATSENLSLSPCQPRSEWWCNPPVLWLPGKFSTFPTSKSLFFMNTPFFPPCVNLEWTSERTEGDLGRRSGDRADESEKWKNGGKGGEGEERTMFGRSWGEIVSLFGCCFKSWNRLSGQILV